MITGLGAMPAPMLVFKLPAESLDLAMPVIKLDFKFSAELQDLARPAETLRLRRWLRWRGRLRRLPLLCW